MSSDESLESLQTYVSDHLGGSETAIALADRLANHFADQPLGLFFASLSTDIRADQQVLKDLAKHLGVDGPALAKQALGRIGEFLARLRTPLSPGAEQFSLFESLEILALGVRGKRSLWAALAVAADPRVAGPDYAGLIRRADEQFDTLEAQRLSTASLVLSLRAG